MGPRFDDDLDYWVDNPDEREDSFGDGYPEGYRHAADCKCSDCRY